MAIVSTTTALEFKVTGQDEVNSALKGISSSIGEVTEAAKQQAAAEAAMAKAQAEAQAREKAQIGLLQRLKGAGDQWTGALKSSAEGLGLLSEGLSKSLGIFGPWAAAAGAALGVVTALWNKLSKPEDTKPSEDQLARLTEAYKALGEAASLSAARMKLAAEEAAKRADQELVEREQSIEQMEKDLAKQRESLQTGWTEIEVMGSKVRHRMSEQEKSAMEQTILDTERKIQAEKDYVDYQKQAAADARREQEKREDEETDRQLRLESIRKDISDREKARADAQRQAEADAAKAQQAAEQARQKKRQEMERQLQRLQQMEEETAKLDSVDAMEAIKREYDLKEAKAKKEFSDEAMRQKALELLEKQRLAAVDKAREDIAKRRAALDQKAQGVSLTKPQDDSEVGKATAQRDALRDKIIKDSQTVSDLMAQYEAEYTADELENNQQYLALKQKQIEIAGNLATAQEQAYSRIAAARQKDMESAEQATFDQVYAAHALTKAQKEAVSALDDGFAKMGEHADQFGAASKAVTAASMVASAIKAGADAIEYGAKSLAYFAAGNPVAGAGMAAASAGEVAAAAAYIKGIADLGGSAPSTPAASTAASGGGAQSLTGSQPSGDRELTVNFAFEGSDSKIADTLIRGLNASTTSLGHQRLRRQMVSERA